MSSMLPFWFLCWLTISFLLSSLKPMSLLSHNFSEVTDTFFFILHYFSNTTTVHKTLATVICTHSMLLLFASYSSNTFCVNAGVNAMSSLLTVRSSLHAPVFLYVSLLLLIYIESKWWCHHEHLAFCYFSCALSLSMGPLQVSSFSANYFTISY